MEERKRPTKQEKKRMKVERMMATRKEKRERKREVKKEKRKEMLNAMSVEERKEFIHQERRLTEELEAETRRAAQEGTWLVIDCSYTALMSELECGSLVSQVEQGTSFLHKQKPQFFKIVLTSLDCRVKEIFLKQHADRWPADLFEEDIVSVPGAGQREIIMLSPDAEEPLGELDLSREAYVIGGLVDRTHKKAATLEKALARGVKARRLPIQETIDPVLRT